MTNTLHRKGSAESLKHDFVIFASPSWQVPDVFVKLGRFSRICLKHSPVNMNYVDRDGTHPADPRRLQEVVGETFGMTATFDNTEALAGVIKALKEADLGISINVSGLLEEVKKCCNIVGMERHSAEQSLGIFGKTELLPQWPVVKINSLCGHGLVSFNLINRVIDEVKTERMTPEEGAYKLTKPCQCGAFNPTRAKQLLEQLRLKR
ncbi:MAG: hypothetical protein V3S89_08105 [Desulfobacterales bacterium]